MSTQKVGDNVKATVILVTTLVLGVVLAVVGCRVLNPSVMWAPLLGIGIGGVLSVLMIAALERWA